MKHRLVRLYVNNLPMRKRVETLRAERRGVNHRVSTANEMCYGLWVLCRVVDCRVVRLDFLGNYM